MLINRLRQIEIVRVSIAMDDVAHYDSQLQYQKRVGEIEKERLQLEREMFSMMRSDKKLQNLRAAKLRSYWQQVCEREKKARERNEDLLKDFEHLEIVLLATEAKTSKLRKMKMEYDEKIKQMYPQWRQEVEIARAKKQLQERGITIKQQKENRSPQACHQPREEATYPVQGPTAPPISWPQKATSSSKTPDVTSLFSASISVSTPAQTPLTSTPKLEKDLNLSGRESVQPPDSFADTAPEEASLVATTASIESPKRTVPRVATTTPFESPKRTAPLPLIATTASIESPKRTTSVVHTIPTAFSSDGGNTDFSDNSLPFEKAARPATGVVSASPHKEQQVLTSRQRRPLKADVPPTKKHSIASPTSSHQTSSIRIQEESYTKPSSPGNRAASTSSPMRTTQAASPITAVSEQRRVIRSPELRPESNLSISSFGSDDLSPRSNATPRSNLSSKSNQPLTANAAYQALLKQHSGGHVKSLEIPEMRDESDDDDLENLLSPRASSKQGKRNEVVSESEEEEPYSDPKRSASPVYIPTAMSAGHSSKVRQQPPKAPWETDSEDEFGTGNTNLSNTAGSSMWDSKLKKYDPQDDFDFYD